MDRDEIKGKAEKAKGFVKDKAGEVMNDPTLAALLERCGFKSSGLYKMDGSKRSSHGNAFFAGFGAGKRKVREGIEEIADDSDRDDE